jgi:DNA-binding transcriptional LysR family regulator
MIDELQAASWFIQIVKAQGFSAAAKALQKSPSALSRAVADLEAQLGTPLLARTTRRLHLTEAGAVYFAHAEALVRAQRAAHDAVAELTGAPRGRLRVTMPVSVGERLLAPHLPAFLARHPDVQLELDLSDRTVALVEEGFDLALRVGRPPDSTLRAQLLGRVGVVTAASPDYLAGAAALKRPADVAVHRCIAIGAVGRAVEWTFFRGAQREVVALDPRIHTSSPALATQLAVAGEGIVRTLDWLVLDELAVGALVPVLPTWSSHHPERGGVPVFALYGTSAAPPLKARVFVDFVKERLADEAARLGITRPKRAPRAHDAQR